MSAILAATFAKFLDPVLLVAALLCAYPIRRRWWGVVLLGVPLGVMYEALSRVVAVGPLSDNPWLTIIPACIAGTADSYLAFLLYSLIRMEWIPTTEPKRSIAIGLMCIAGPVLVIAPGPLLAMLPPTFLLGGISAH